MKVERELFKCRERESAFQAKGKKMQKTRQGGMDDTRRQGKGLAASGYGRGMGCMEDTRERKPVARFVEKYLSDSLD